MFFFENFTVSNILIAVVVLLGLIGVNEFTRRSKWASIGTYIIMPILLAIFVWPKTAIRGDGDWFPIVKTLSALAGVIGFMAIRYIEKLQTKKWVLIFPVAILVINILEAIGRDIEIYMNYNGQKVWSDIEGLMMQGGPWNIINAIAGIFLIITLTGWFGIKISKDKSRDMVWVDQLWFWIIAYDLWNMAYVYNCISTRAMYAGFLLLISCTVCEFFFKRGVWLQHRAQTLALWGMFSVTFSSYSSSPLFSITSTYDVAPLYFWSILALVSNVAVFIYEIMVVYKTKRNPLKDDIYCDLKAYKRNLEENGLLIKVPLKKVSMKKAASKK